MNHRSTIVLAAAVAIVTASAGARMTRQLPAAAPTGADPPPNAIWLDSLDLGKMVQRRQQPRAGRSARNNPLTLGGVVYQHRANIVNARDFDATMT